MAFIDKLFKEGIVRSEEVANVMKRVDRADFCYNPYEDKPQGIGYNVTISAPHMHAMALVSAPNQ